ncbi:MAG: cyclic nucleotide-binding domain-containing protein [Gallionella sp.]|nr:cyclic nucleotide-binding domain-containing protein [Gallionella sp.]MDP1941599.1 cyclic nucleotide-binding domain-containing protein [Gallionella sp.]
MFKQLVFGLTEKGEREIRLCMLSLSGDAQLILPLFGKSSTVDKVVAMLPPIARSGVPVIVSQLLAAGYIVQQDTVLSPNTPRPAGEASYTAMPVMDFYSDAEMPNSQVGRLLESINGIKPDVAETNLVLRGMVEYALSHPEPEKPSGGCAAVTTSNSGTMLETLRELVFFNDFTAAELSEVAYIVLWHEREKNQLILREGEVVNSFFVLLNGTAAVLKEQSPIGLIQQGESFGEFAYIMGEQASHTADVIAKSYVEFLEFPTDKLKLATPQVRLQFASAFARVQTQRLICANEQIVSLLADKYR